MAASPSPMLERILRKYFTLLSRETWFPEGEYPPPKTRRLKGCFFSCSVRAAPTSSELEAGGQGMRCRFLPSGEMQGIELPRSEQRQGRRELTSSRYFKAISSSTQAICKWIHKSRRSPSVNQVATCPLEAPLLRLPRNLPERIRPRDGYSERKSKPEGNACVFPVSRNPQKQFGGEEWSNY